MTQQKWGVSSRLPGSREQVHLRYDFLLILRLSEHILFRHNLHFTK